MTYVPFFLSCTTLLIILQKSCLQSKSVADLKGAFSSNPFQKTGLGSGPIGISTTNSHKFWPHVDDNIITENPVTRGRQVPLIVGYSMGTHNLLQTSTNSPIL